MPSNELPLFYDPRRLHTLWLTEWSRAMDRYLRSAPFLRLMHFNLRALTRSPYLPFALGRK